MMHSLLLTPAARTRRRLTEVGACVRRHGAPLVAVELLLGSAILPVAKRLLPLKRLVRAVALAARCSGVRSVEVDALVRLAWTIFRPLLRKGDGVCLERSLAVYYFLLRGGRAATLVVGARPSGEITEWHAWVELLGTPVTEPASALSGFVPVVAFGAGGEQQEPVLADPGWSEL